MVSVRPVSNVETLSTAEAAAKTVATELLLAAVPSASTAAIVVSAGAVTTGAV